MYKSSLVVSTAIFVSSVLFSFTQPEAVSTQTEPNLDESIKLGKEIYSSYCISCHMNEGAGIPGAFPPLAESDYLMEDKERSIHIVMYGLEGEIVVNGTTYNNIMTPLGLSDEEITHVLNYVRNSWGNEGEVVTFEEVKAVREAGE
ncbi:c-type cytochrome [Catalinimonas niigatensis]|uniref:c-type cytochrome n=1 Tax=Catalinimonas niigatensis TaxID=1397264 RepID=UPI002665ACD0|nr:cytochrome c [Catalinimonas niigatensis]WPP48605.1 cytochrome c [Catalinimonas niigatensis]